MESYEEILERMKNKFTELYFPICKYIYVPVCILVLILGIALGGIG